MPEDYHSSQVQSWFVSVQRELWRGALVDLAYIGNRADDLLLFANLNQAAPNNSAGTLSLQSRRPIPGFGGHHLFVQRRQVALSRVPGQVRLADRRGLLDSQLADAVADQGQRRRLARRAATGTSRRRRTSTISTPTSARAPITSRTTTRPASCSTLPFGTGRRFAEQCVAGARRAHRRLADRRRQHHLRGRAGDAHLHADRGVPGLRHSAGLPRREQLSAERHRRGAGAERISGRCRTGSAATRRGHPDRSEPAVRQRAAQRLSRADRCGRWTSRRRSASRCRGGPATSSSAPSSSTCSTARTSARRTATASIAAAAFGTITATYDPRIIQFGLKFNY